MSRATSGPSEREYDADRWWSSMYTTTPPMITWQSEASQN